MANFIDTFSSQRTADESYSSLIVTPVDCEMATAMLNFEPMSNYRHMIFLASDSETFGIQGYAEAENTTAGQHATKTEMLFQITNASSNQDVTSATNGGKLLELANRYKDLYFDGVTQSTASLKQFLDGKYGPHAYYYSALTLFGNIIWIPEVNVQYPSVVRTAEPYTWPLYDAQTYNPETAENPDVEFNGTSISWPSTLPDPLQEDDDRPAMRAWWVFQGPEPERHLQFDVYVNGTKDPNVAIRWKAVSQGNVSLQLVTPIVWTTPTPTPLPQIVDDGGILIPNETVPTMRKYANTFAGSYTKPYLTEYETDTESLTQLEKVARYGLDGIAGNMNYHMRFNYQINVGNIGQMTWGDLFTVTVPREVDSIGDILVTKREPSAFNPQYSTSVVIHLGTPEDEIPDDSEDYPQGTDPSGTDPGVYDPDYTPYDFSGGIPIGFPGKAILTRTYSMNANVLQNIGSKLWSQAYFNVLKIQSNPIENIVSCKWFPFSRTGAQTDVKVGDINFEIQAGKLDAIYKFHVGSVKYIGYWSRKFGELSYLDGSPYTVILLHLPWCGTVELDASMMINQVISVDYVVDLITGDCVAFITINPDSYNMPYMSVSGHVGVDIPLTSTDRIQAEIRAASTTFSAVGSAAAGVATGNYLGAAEAAAGGAASVAGMDVTSQRSSAHSNACMSYENKKVFLEIWRPVVDPDLMKEGFKARHGWPCHKFMKLSSFSGFTKCSQNCKIDFAMTSEENRMIEQLLTSGVYI